MKKALIIGVSGQDGAYLAKLLLEKGYEVHGTSRDAELSSFSRLKHLGIFSRVGRHSMSPTDFRSVMQTILEIEPNEIYNLAGQTSVGLSFAQPVDTTESISTGTLNILEVIRFHKLPARYYNASSSECFGDTAYTAADELTPFQPRSPYAVAKASAFWFTSVYRKAYNLFAASGILFNHESPLRSPRFVTKKIINTACRIHAGEDVPLRLGDLSVRRDWGWAPEYVESMYRILQHDTPEDFVIATGKECSLLDFVEKTFSFLGLDYRDHVEFEKNFIRPYDIPFSLGRAEKAERILGWKAKTRIDDIIAAMIKWEMERLQDSSRGIENFNTM
ncbi:MAG: GDP-mannose 4,6-dehydratase [Deltaproteobacteria bacterium]|nr:GDP-mannose 4,6-dehydratase [Deltaproteobacteria bacterium]